MMTPLLLAGAAMAVLLVGVALAFRAVNRFALGGRLGAGRSAFSVVARVGLGPRQGLAVVRVGERGVVVSLGEGGVHRVLELSPEELAGVEASSGIGAAQASALGSAAAARVGRRLRSFIAFSAAVALPFAANLTRPAVASAAPVEVADVAAVGLANVAAVEASDDAPVDAAAVASPIVQQPAAQVPAGSGAAAIDSVASRLLPQIGVTLGSDDDGLRLSGTVGMVIVIGLLTTLPTLLLLMTSFTRILVVLHFLRQALGTQSAPPAHLMAALALLLTGFVMAPTLREVNATALQPWTEGEITEGEMLSAAAVPMRAFMLRQTREEDLALFLELSETGPVATEDEIPLATLMSAFAVGELRTAFQIGFAIFLPFVVIDIVVAAVLTSMGMFMLPPAMIALPLKLMLFVLVDGWTLVVQSLFESFL